MKIPFAKAMSPAMNHALTRWLALCVNIIGWLAKLYPFQTAPGTPGYMPSQRIKLGPSIMARGNWKASRLLPSGHVKPFPSTRIACHTHPLNAIALQLHAAYLMPGAHRRLPHTGTSLAYCRLLVAADPHRRPWNLDTSRWHLVLQHWSLTTHCLPLAA